LITSAETAPLGGSEVVSDHKRQDVRRAGPSVVLAPALKHCEQCIGAQPKLGGAGALPQYQMGTVPHAERYSRWMQRPPLFPSALVTSR
jgi:hypothetical protein